MPGEPWFFFGTPPYATNWAGASGPTPTKDDVQGALRDFLAGILQAGVGVYAGQDNRVPEPQESNYVLITPLGAWRRMATNYDNFVDTLVQGSISGTLLTVSQTFYGAIEPSAILFAGTVSPGTRVVSKGSAPNTWIVNLPQTVASTKIAAGQAEIQMTLEAVFQIDVHGPQSTDNAGLIATLFRDTFATSYFESVLDGVDPVSADDPKQIPFINAENQYEFRWVVDAKFSVVQTVTVPQQFFDVAGIVPVDVDVAFPGG